MFARVFARGSVSPLAYLVAAVMAGEVTQTLGHFDEPDVDSNSPFHKDSRCWPQTF